MLKTSFEEQVKYFMYGGKRWMCYKQHTNTRLSNPCDLMFW